MAAAEVTIRGRRAEVVEAKARRRGRASGTSRRSNAGIDEIGRRNHIGTFDEVI